MDNIIFTIVVVGGVYTIYHYTKTYLRFKKRKEELKNGKDS